MADRRPLQLHPGAWWLWALALATAAAATTNVVVLALLGAAVCVVVMRQRSDAPWALSFHQYLVVAGIILAFRILMRLVFRHGDELQVALHAGAADGMRLAVMIICVGAANALANPKQLLASLPGALHEVGTATVIALTFFPQLVDSVQRVSRARRLRAPSATPSGARRRGMRLRRRATAIRDVLVPVLEDAFDRSLQLAASMDARGYGRAGSATTRERHITGAFLLLGLIGTCVGMYATLDTTTPRLLATPLLVLGVVLAVIGFVHAGRRVQRTRYRHPRWGLVDVTVIGTGIAATATMFVARSLDRAALQPLGLGFELPPISLLSLCAVLVAMAPALLYARGGVTVHSTRPAAGAIS